MGRYYADRGHDVPFTWVPNGVTLDEQTDDGQTFDDSGPERGGQRVRHDEAPDTAFTITYIGSMGPANALEAVIDGFDLAVRRAASTGGPSLALRLVGDGADVTALRERASRLPSADRVSWDGRVPQGEARRIGRQADCLVVNMHDLPLYRHGVSMNKQYEYMLLGRALLVGSPVPLEPVVASGSGLHVTPDDPEALADGMLALASMSAADRAAMGARGRAHVIREHSYRRLAGTLAAALDAATAH
ncbi:glycosyltransferase [Curtobacterium sp. 24E2]|nr:glycosyltransferase [Curtobacterium sp. 24E2]